MKKTVIVVPSTTHYSDAWGPCVALIKKFWPTCPFKVILVTDTKTDPWDGDDAIVVGEDKGWCKNLIYGLNKIDAENIILWQEDFFLNKPVDEAFVLKALELMDEKNLACFRLYPCPLPDWKLTEEYGRISPGQSYRVSCQLAIWAKQELYEIAGHPSVNSPREFEIIGSNIANTQHADCQYYAYAKKDPNSWPVQYYCSAITRGEWNPDAVDFVKSLDIPIDNTRRRTMRIIT